MAEKDGGMPIHLKTCECTFEFSVIIYKGKQISVHFRSLFWSKKNIVCCCCFSFEEKICLYVGIFVSLSVDSP